MQTSPTDPTHPYRVSLLRQWAWRVVLPLVLAMTLAFILLIYATWPEGSPPQMLWRAGLLLVVTLAYVVAISWRIALRVIRPLAELAEAVERLGRGEQVRLKLVREGGAIARLQDSVNRASQALADARKRMLSSIELAEKNAKLEQANLARARLLAAASHDLRQPLYALTLFSSTLRAGETDPDKLARIGHIEDCVASLDQLFSALLDLSRLEAGSMQAQPCNLAVDDVLAEVSRNFRMLAESRGLRLVVRKTDARAYCDRTMLTRILNNLVSNALRYTSQGGVLVGVRWQPPGQIRIDVWDTGCGIAPEHQQRVFEEFYQVPQTAGQHAEGRRGLGLGLATVKRLTELIGGRLSLASRPGKGTRVSLWVPACSAPIPECSQTIDAPLDLEGLRVLVIDDEATILHGLRLVLSEWGCDVRTADSRQDALRALRGWTKPPDVVISDLHLGPDETGLEVLDAIATTLGQDPQQPAFARLVVTGETRPDMLSALTNRRIPVLFKPIPPQCLREAMLAATLAVRARLQRFEEPA